MFASQNKIWKTLDYEITRSDNNYISKRKSGDLSRQVLLKMNTLLDEFDIYLHRQGVAQTTKRKYVKDVKQFCVGLDISHTDEINRDNINKWILIFRNKNRTTGTIAAILWAIKKFLVFVWEEKSIPCYKWDISIPKVPPPESVEFLELEEIKSIYNLLDTNDICDLRMRTLIEVMLNTGMRPSETLSLRRADFAEKINELEIVGKGKKKRNVYFPPHALYWISQYLSQRTDNHPALFVTHNGKKIAHELRLRSVEYNFQQLIAKSNIKRHIVLHDLRHSFATQYAAKGCDAGYIMLLLGHSSVKTTRKYYIAVSKKHAKEAFFKFNPFAELNSREAIPSRVMPLPALLN